MNHIYDTKTHVDSITRIASYVAKHSAREGVDGIMPTLVQQIAMTLGEINRNEGVTIVIVEQNVPLIFKMADYCVVLEKGRLVAEGTREEVSQSETSSTNHPTGSCRCWSNKSR